MRFLRIVASIERRRRARREFLETLKVACLQEKQATESWQKNLYSLDRREAAIASRRSLRELVSRYRRTYPDEIRAYLRRYEVRGFHRLLRR
ncbi:MAG: hypothetical protein HY220_01840 [Candidatus Sungbacteria bacterium]|uniref:Uncharacterized protein n=1 Tax=Candidatus Sungiibacteriota bacterium TaxID=2750080 RepID=A0A9D6LTN8_9BACT|nr:hypothetical protein [Candidatus Sungbacteria bacterium]